MSMTYPCPQCGNEETRIYDTRAHENGGVMRRRQCLACKYKWITMEAAVLPFKEESAEEKGQRISMEELRLLRETLEIALEHVQDWIDREGT